MKKIISIVGPTSTQKSDLGYYLAKKINGEIISCDSMQVYKTMNIISNKPNKTFLDDLPHHLIGIIDIDKNFSVAQYVDYANYAVEKIVENGKIPILVGGTGLYANSFLNGIKFEKENNNDIRENLECELKEKGVDFLYKKLQDLDYEYSKKVEKNNTKRIIRAIEKCLITNKTQREQIKDSLPKTPPYKVYKIGLNYRDRANLYKKIEDRTDIMIKRGIVDEAKKLYNAKNLSKTASLAIGYREFVDYFEGKISLKEAIINLKKNTRHYAKRQITWFKRDEDIKWFYLDEMSLDEILTNIICDMEKFLYL